MKLLRFILTGIIALGSAHCIQAVAADDPYKGYEEAAYMDLELEQNLLCPTLASGDHAGVRRHMRQIGQELASKGYTVDTMRDGEVILVSIPTDQLFNPNDTLLSNYANGKLLPVINMLKDPAMYKVVYAVHTDNTGSPSYNMALSHARNNSIYDWILSKVSEDQIVIPYELGDTDPVDVNNTRAGRAANRRLEIYLVPGPKLITMARKGQLK